MRSVLRAAVAVSLFYLAGCCTAPKLAVSALSQAWDDGTAASIKPYAVAGVMADPLLGDEPGLTEEEKVARKEAKARRLRTIEEFGLTLKALGENSNAAQ